MPISEVKRPRRVRVVDRESWPALAKVEFDVHVTGECWALTGPWWFGRAYEHPPFFAYSATSNVAISPNVTAYFTAGVESWLTDDRGMYLGAMVWMMVGAPVVTPGD